MVGFLCLAYGLWVQNRYLLWTSSHPEHVREPGALTTRLDYFILIGIFLHCFLSWVDSKYFWRSLGITWRHVLDRSLPRSVARRPVPRGLLTASAILAVTGILCGIYLVMTGVETYVWEGWEWEGSIAGLSLIVAVLLFWEAGAILWRVARESQLALYGLPVKKKKEGIQLQRGADLKALSKVIAIEFVVVVALYFLIDSGSRLVFCVVFFVAWLCFFGLLFLVQMESGFLALLCTLAVLFLLASGVVIIFLLNPSPLVPVALIIGSLSGALAGFLANWKKVTARVTD